MDKIDAYAAIIVDFLKAYEALKNKSATTVMTKVLMDKEAHHYQLLRLGWQEQRYVFSISFHFSLQDGKLWVHQNNTEVMVADELIARGVAPTDIVLGFVPEALRTEFA
jgi:hypothetical protein